RYVYRELEAGERRPLSGDRGGYDRCREVVGRCHDHEAAWCGAAAAGREQRHSSKELEVGDGLLDARRDEDPSGDNHVAQLVEKHDWSSRVAEVRGRRDLA